MSSTDDSRPFVDLRRRSQAFATRFDDDIKSCLDILDSKLSSLLKDPESLESPTKEAKRLGAEMQFSKAKLNIFTGLQDELRRMESEWNSQLKVMVHSFLENVEILLASLNFAASFSKFDAQNSLTAGKSRKTPEKSSLIPSSLNAYSILSTAKRIPVLNSFLQTDNEEVDDTLELPSDSDEANEVEEVEESNIMSRSSISIRRSSSQSSPIKQSTAKSLQRKTGENISKRALRSKETTANQPGKSTPKKNSGKSKKSILKMDLANDVELHATPSRATRNKTAVKESNQANSNDVCEMEWNGNDSAAPKTPKNVHFSSAHNVQVDYEENSNFSVGLDVEDDLDIYSPEAKLTRSAPRRKTVLISKFNDSSSDFNLTPNTTRSKRKTIGGSAMDVPAPSAKRFKGKQSPKVSTISEEKEESNLLDNDESNAAEHYTPWVLLDELSLVPAEPGIYELKVYKAKKSAYIGSCDNLRQKLTLHKLGQNSGHKHLDKFLERNKKEVQVRYERIPSANAAKNEEMNRIKAFVVQHRTTPAYN